MALKIYNPETAPNLRSNTRNTPGIGLYAKNGQLLFNKSLCDLLAIKEGNKVQLAQDDENPKAWFFNFSSDVGYTLRATKNGLTFANRIIGDAIFQSQKSVARSGRITVNPAPVKLEKAFWYSLNFSGFKLK